MSYLRNSWAAGTRQSYHSGVASFRQWRIDRRRPADELPTADEIGSWVAELADKGQHTAGTLNGYVSAVGAWYVENRRPTDLRPLPSQDPGVVRILKGIARDRAERAQALPLSSVDAGSRPLLLPTLLQFLFDESRPRDLMFKAASMLAVAGGLRPGELLGNQVQRDRALRREQLAFFADSAGTVLAQPPGDGAIPRVLQVTLRQTKTVQLAATVKYIAAAPVIIAVWRWFCDTADRGPNAFLFRLEPAGPMLTTYALVCDLNRRHEKAGLGAAAFTGKSFRQGGAGTLAAQGYDAQHIAALGWSVNSSQWERYSRDPAVQRQRAIQRAGLMMPGDPSPPDR